MSKKNIRIAERMNLLFTFLGIHGGRIHIEEDWIFNFRIRDLGDGDHEIEIYSESKEEEAFRDPFFRMDVVFDESRKRIVSIRPTEYLSQWWGGELRIDPDDNLYDSEGNTEHIEGELEERLSSYLETIVEIRDYLRSPNLVERFEEDVDCTYMQDLPQRKRLRKEAMARMRILGIDLADREGFEKGKLTKVYVDHEKRKIRKMEMTMEEREMVRKAQEESGTAFLAYYVIEDSIQWPDGEKNTRYILPCVWEEEGEGEEGSWGRIRRNILKYGWLPCYTINKENPEYSEFGELPFQVSRGTLYTIG